MEAIDSSLPKDSVSYLRKDEMFLSTKTIGHDRGLSCCFRQWAAESHCNLIHGYSLSFKFVFASEQLDHRNWVVDFGKGGFSEIKQWLEYMFDHTMLVAEDDPQRSELERLAELGLCEVRLVRSTGCEMTAKIVFDKANEIIQNLTGGRCWVESVEVAEHGANSAIYRNTRAIPLQLEVEELTQAILDSEE
jgi:6-pyruvoyltetrahydropterin/6-carboxytetrahydropterin synthase